LTGASSGEHEPGLKRCGPEPPVRSGFVRRPAEPLALRAGVALQPSGFMREGPFQYGGGTREMGTG